MTTEEGSESNGALLSLKMGEDHEPMNAGGLRKLERAKETDSSLKPPRGVQPRHLLNL